MSRKRTLVDHGFRLPSAMDNRPLKWEEFLERIGQTVYLSATPGPYELGRVKDDVVEQVIRPTGLVDPKIVVEAAQGPDRRPDARDQDPGRARRAGAGHHADQEDGRGPHRLPAARTRSGSATCTPRSTRCAGSSCCASCAQGEYDVLVGINLLREGLDLPEVSLVSILDADKEGFLRMRHLADPDHRPGRPQRLRRGAHVRRHDHAVDAARRSTRPTGAARSRSPTTSSSGIDPQPLRKRIADILDDIVRGQRTS